MLFITQEELVEMMFVLGECYRNPILATQIYADCYSKRWDRKVSSFRKSLEMLLYTGQIQYPTQAINNPFENEFIGLATGKSSIKCSRN